METTVSAVSGTASIPPPPPTPAAQQSQQSQFYIIADASGIKYLKAAHPLEEVLLFCGDNRWGRGFEKALKYTDINAAVIESKKLSEELKTKLFAITINGNQIGVAEVVYS